MKKALPLNRVLAARRTSRRGWTETVCCGISSATRIRWTILRSSNLLTAGRLRRLAKSSPDKTTFNLRGQDFGGQDLRDGGWLYVKAVGKASMLDAISTPVNMRGERPKRQR